MATATVKEDEKCAIFGVNTGDGSSRFVRQDMTDDQIADYKRFPDVYFGRITPVHRVVNTRVQLFESLLEQNEMARDVLLNFFTGHPQLEEFKNASNEDLRARYCEEMVARAVAGGFKARLNGTKWQTYRRQLNF